MYSVTMETTARGVETSVAHLVKDSAGFFWAGRIAIPFLAKRLTGRVKNLNIRLAESNVRLLEMSRSAPFDGDEVIDASLQLRDHLETIKTDALQFRSTLMSHRLRLQKASAHSSFKARLVGTILEEVGTSVALCSEMFEIANKLQWDVAEHDADRAVRYEGFVASSAGDVMAILNRL
jgi:hypothetical protein